MSTWAVLKAEIQKTLDRPNYETGGTDEAYLLTWVNRVIEKACTILTLPDHIKSSQATITTANHKWSLPTDYLKTIPSTKIRVGDDYVDLVPLTELDYLDPNHSETTAATEPDYAAIEGGYLYVYPKIACTIVIESYIRKPTAITLVTESPDLTSHYMVDDLVISGVCEQGFRWENEKDLATEQDKLFARNLQIYKSFLDVRYPSEDFVSPAYDVNR